MGNNKNEIEEYIKKSDKAKKEKLYVMQSGIDDAYKIGRTTRNCNKRRNELQTGNPNKLTTIKEIQTSYSNELENKVHKQLKKNQISGEFYKNIGEIGEAIDKNLEEINSKTYRLKNKNGEIDKDSDYFYFSDDLDNKKREENNND